MGVALILHMKKAKIESKLYGIKRLIAQGRRRFRVPENLNHYSEEDFLNAERKFLKECIVLGKCRL